ncbi:MAG: phosphoribosyltransferase [Oscillospiraceae bacterium]|nr:phosphoribosyltransferase [Oscillospiraceae bacterium]
MESKAYSLSCEKNPHITLRVIPGHFTTSNSHLSHFIDVSGLKSNVSMAREVAKELAYSYLSTTQIDTIVCVERTEVIGAFLAEELMASGVSAIGGGDIHIITPISNNIGTLSFLSSVVNLLAGRNILLLTTSVSSGRSLNGALDCLAYYRANIVGISTLFMVSSAHAEHEVNALFTSDAIPGYKSFSSRDCELCRAGLPLDALISSEGFTKI